MNNKREFNEEEISFIVNNWGSISCYRMRKVLSCSYEALIKVAKKYNLEIPKSNAWSNEEESLLKELAPLKSIDEIGKILNKSSNAISIKARKMGIVILSSKRNWTKEEEDTLRRVWGSKSIESISRTLHRSVYSLKVKANKLHLGPMYGNDAMYLTIPMISDMLKVSYDTVNITWRKLGLKIEEKILTKSKKYYGVSWDNLILFLKNNQDRWDSKKLDIFSFGEEEEWLLRKREKDSITKNNSYRRWSEEEIEEVKRLFLVEKKNYEEIALLVNRSSSAVQRLLRSMGYQYRLPMYWSGEELLYLKDNCNDKSYLEISKHLGRSVRAVKNKVYQMKYKNNDGDRYEDK